MSDSKSGSKSDLNESNMPLLDEEQKEKEAIEMGEKDDSGEKEKDKKKKEKKKKEPKEKKPKGPNKIDVLSEGLNLGNRDGNAINTEVDLGFDDVLAEPSSAQGFDAIWKLSFVIFTHVKLWLYRLFAAVVAVPASIVWALIFALITVLYVWVFSPALRLFEFGAYIFRRILNGVMRATVEPVCSAFGAVFSNMSVSQRRHIVQDA